MTRPHFRFAPFPLQDYLHRWTEAYSFERWQRSPVYVAQCFSCWVQRSIDPSMFGRLRVVRKYRSPLDQETRDKVARAIRQLRRCGLHRDTVMHIHEHRLNEPGVAVRVDIERELAEMAC